MAAQRAAGAERRPTADPEQSWARITNKLLVAPVVSTLVYENIPSRGGRLGAEGGEDGQVRADRAVPRRAPSEPVPRRGTPPASGSCRLRGGGGEGGEVLPGRAHGSAARGGGFPAGHGGDLTDESRGGAGSTCARRRGGARRSQGGVGAGSKNARARALLRERKTKVTRPRKRELLRLVTPRVRGVYAGSASTNQLTCSRRVYCLAAGTRRADAPAVAGEPRDVRGGRAGERPRVGDSAADGDASAADPSRSPARDRAAGAASTSGDVRSPVQVGATESGAETGASPRLAGARAADHCFFVAHHGRGTGRPAGPARRFWRPRRFRRRRRGQRRERQSTTRRTIAVDGRARVFPCSSSPFASTRPAGGWMSCADVVVALDPGVRRAARHRRVPGVQAGPVPAALHPEPLVVRQRGGHAREERTCRCPPAKTTRPGSYGPGVARSSASTRSSARRRRAPTLAVRPAAGEPSHPADEPRALELEQLGRARTLGRAVRREQGRLGERPFARAAMARS